MNNQRSQVLWAAAVVLSVLGVLNLVLAVDANRTDRVVQAIADYCGDRAQFAIDADANVIDDADDNVIDDADDNTDDGDDANLDNAAAGDGDGGFAIGVAEPPCFLNRGVELALFGIVYYVCPNLRNDLFNYDTW